MRYSRKLITDATILSGVLVFSYYVYVMGEYGYLQAYGVENPTSYITLEVQSIIFGFLIALFYFITFILLVVIFALLASHKNDKKRWINKEKILFFALFCLLILISSPILIDKFGASLASLFTFIMMVLILIIIFVPLPKLKTSAYEQYNKLFRLLFKHSQNKVGKYKSLALLALIIAIIYTPFINYVISYNDVAATPYKNAQIISRNKAQYLIIRQYSDKIISVKISGDQLIPNYLVLRSDEMKDLQYIIESRHFDLKALHPKSTPIIKANQMLKATFHLL